MSVRIKRTLIYCLVAFTFLGTLYYVVYGFAGDKLAADARLSTSLMYAGITTMFLGAVHYFVINKPDNSGRGTRVRTKFFQKATSYSPASHPISEVNKTFQHHNADSTCP